MTRFSAPVGANLGKNILDSATSRAENSSSELPADSPDSFADLTYLLHQTREGPRWMAFVHLYLDESGHSSRHPYVVVAGFIGIAEAWEGFKAKWNAILELHHVKPPFHMTDFEAKKEQFEGWDEEKQRRPLMKALMDEVASRQIFLFGAAVSVEWFKSVNWRSEFPGSEPPEDPYHLVMQDAVHEAKRVCAVGSEVAGIGASGNKLAVIMEEQRQFEGAAQAYYRAIHAFDETDTLLKAATFASGEEYPQLQAADIAAFELRWRLTRPDIVRYPWARIQEKGVQQVYFRGIDPKAAFPEWSYEPDPDPPLVLQVTGKRTANQGKRLRKKEPR
jgi:hypothetical protein